MTDFVGTSGDDSIVGTSGDDEFDLTAGGSDTVDGGGGYFDTFILGAALDADDQLIGGLQTDDEVLLDGDYLDLTITSSMFASIDEVALQGEHDYRITLADGVVQEGRTLSFDALRLGPDAEIFIDASALTSGAIAYGSDIRAKNDDTVIGSAQDDEFFYWVAGGQQEATC